LIVCLKGADTVIEVWTRPTGQGKTARYADVVRFSARAGEWVPIEHDGSERGKVSVADPVALQA
jgi:hypothetical protein